MLHTLSREHFLPISLTEAWDFFSSPGNLDEITPDELGFKIVYQPGDRMYEGQIIEYKVMAGSGDLGSVGYGDRARTVRQAEAGEDFRFPEGDSCEAIQQKMKSGKGDAGESAVAMLA